MINFGYGFSTDIITLNWTHLKELLVKLEVSVTMQVIDEIRNFRDGAAEQFLEELYCHFTGRQISKVKPMHPVDFSDHAYQVQSSIVKSGLWLTDQCCQQGINVDFRCKKYLANSVDKHQSCTCHIGTF